MTAHRRTGEEEVGADEAGMVAHLFNFVINN